MQLSKKIVMSCLLLSANCSLRYAVRDTEGGFSVKDCIKQTATFIVYNALPAFVSENQEPILVNVMING